MAESQGGDMGRNVDIDEVRDMRDQLNRAMVDMRDQILRVVDTGFKGTHRRQDITNGRVGKLEETAGRLDERLDANDERVAALERDNEAFHQHRRVDDMPAPALKDPDGDDRRITQRDARVLLLGAGGAIGLLKLLQWLGPILMRAGTP